MNSLRQALIEQVIQTIKNGTAVLACWVINTVIVFVALSIALWFGWGLDQASWGDASDTVLFALQPLMDVAIICGGAVTIVRVIGVLYARCGGSWSGRAPYFSHV